MKTYLLAATAVGLCAARAYADLNFDATTVEPDTGVGDPIPPGWYNVQADESTMKPTKDGTGKFLEVRFSVLDGQYAGRKIYSMFNMVNASAQAVEIGQKQLSALCHAVNVLKPAKSEQLHGIPLKVKVAIKPASGDYAAGNKINAYKNINEPIDAAGGDSAAGAAAFGAGAPTAPSSFTSGQAQNLASPPAEAPPAQPWAQGGAQGAGAGAPPPPPAAEAPPPPAAHDPMAAAVADGWIKHPSAPGYHYKGQDVKTDDDVAALYPAPSAPPAAPAAPAAPPPPPAADGGAPVPPWAQGSK
jgi:hypothetical protein